MPNLPVLRYVNAFVSDWPVVMSSIPEGDNMKLWAHRESGAGGPLENTMAAFEGYCGWGGWHWLDVHLSVDGIPIVFHDETLERLTPSGDKGVLAKSRRTPSFCMLLHNSARMPTLAQVLTEIGPHTPKY